VCHERLELGLPYIGAITSSSPSPSFPDGLGGYDRGTLPEHVPSTAAPSGLKRDEDQGLQREVSEEPTNCFISTNSAHCRFITAHVVGVFERERPFAKLLGSLKIKFLPVI